MPDEVMKPEEAASYLRLHLRTVQKMAREGALPAIRLGRLWRFRKADLEQWLHDSVSTGQPRLPHT